MFARISDTVLQKGSSYNTISIQTPLAHAIGTNETIVYNALISKYFYYEERNKLGEDGSFRISENDLQESTTLCGKVLTRLMKRLESRGLIKQEMCGMPARKFVTVVRDDELLKSILNEGLSEARSIYPKTTNAQFWGDTSSISTSSDGFLSMFSDKHKLFVNRLLAHSIGLEQAVVWSVIVCKYFQCRKYGTLREDGSFYITEVDIAEMCGYKRKKQKAAIDSLIESGFIEVKLSGAPARRYFRIIISEKQLNEYYSQGLEISKSVYSMTSEAAERAVREKEMSDTDDNFDETILSQSAEQDRPKWSFKAVPNSGSRLSETAEQECPKGSFKNVQNVGTRTDEMAEHTFNHKNKSYIYQSISQNQPCNCPNTLTRESNCNIGLTDGLKSEEKEKIISEIREHLKERIGYSWYKDIFSDSYICGLSNADSLEQVDYVINTLADAVLKARENGFIQLSRNGMTVTKDEIEERFLKKLEKRHIEFFFEKLDKSKVRNIRAYTLTAMYNAVDDAEMLKDNNSTISDERWYEMARSFDRTLECFDE